MENQGAKGLYGLIGYPVKHSFSAFMQNAAFAHYKMNAEYQLFEVAPEGLEEFFRKTISAKKIKGFNVTVPYKERSIDYLTGSVSPNVKMNNAVNTVRVEKDGFLSGFNTDGPGFSRDLKDKGVDFSQKNIVLLGAGGGAKSVVTRIASYYPKRILVFDIDKAKSAKLVEIVNEYYSNVAIEAVDSKEALKIKESDMLINATPVGMKETDSLLIEKEWLHPGLFVYDLIYNPGETKLLKAARAAGCRCANGLGMLLYQGCLAFEHWTGKDAPVEVMLEALKGRGNG